MAKDETEDPATVVSAMQGKTRRNSVQTKDGILGYETFKIARE